MPFELLNTQRKYFGLKEIQDSWDRISLSEAVIVYFQKNKIVKIIHYNFGYLEYDTEIDTVNREILLSKKAKGKEQKLTISKLLKVKGSGMQFSGSFVGGGISVYDNSRNIFFIKSYPEEGPIFNYIDIKNWVLRYIAESPGVYFEWLNNQLNKKREKNKIKAGDIIAFPIGRFEYGFARILMADFLSEHLLDNGEIITSNHFGKTLIIQPYTIISKALHINFDELITQPTLNPIEINESCVLHGEFPIVSFKEIHKSDMPKIELSKLRKYLTIPYNKTDIIQKNSRW